MTRPVRLTTYRGGVAVDVHYADTFALDGGTCGTCHVLAAEALERMTGGGVAIGVLCRYGDRRLPVEGYANIGGGTPGGGFQGRLPVPHAAATDQKMVAMAEPPIDFGVSTKWGWK